MVLVGASEAVVEELVDGVDLAFEVGGHEDERDDDAAQDVAEGELEVGEVALVGDAWDAEEGGGAGLGGDDRDHDGPGGDVALAQEVALEALGGGAEVSARRVQPRM